MTQNIRNSYSTKSFIFLSGASHYSNEKTFRNRVDLTRFLVFTEKAHQSKHNGRKIDKSVARTHQGEAHTDPSYLGSPESDRLRQEYGRLRKFHSFARPLAFAGTCVSLGGETGRCVHVLVVYQPRIKSDRHMGEASRSMIGSCRRGGVGGG